VVVLEHTLYTYCTLLCLYDFKNYHFSYFQGKSIAIFYGSQTGTAEEFAGRLAKDAQRYGLKSAVFDPEEIDIVSLLQ
jgi:sulfite reductase alpha subunit-like flavoprotein